MVIKDLRGNVDTRLRKLDEGQYDALILASAGLRRLGLANRISAAISTDEMLPAVGQGAIAIETRADNEFALETVNRLNHRETRLACLAERAFLRELGGGCQFPIAAHAVVCQEARIEGLVANQTDLKSSRACIRPPDKAEELGADLAHQLIERGANALRSAVKKNQPQIAPSADLENGRVKFELSESLSNNNSVKQPSQDAPS